MGNLVLSSVSMTSRQIADLVGSRHDKVKQSILRLATDNLNRKAVIQLPPMVEVINHLGQMVSEYVFSGEGGKRDSIIVVAQLSPEFTAKIVDRWQELESGLKKNNIPSIPQTYAEALRLAADQAEQLALAAPKVEFVDRYVTADSGSKGFRQVAKLINANEKEFREFLKDRKIMYRLNGEWMPYQQHIEAGRFEVKAGIAENDHAYNTARFTPKGVAWVAGLWAHHKLAVKLEY